MTVIVPYHFVPLSKWVYLPDWAHLISHDIPFADGLCGSIKYTLKNQSPLLVGGHHSKNQDDSTTVEWAKDADGTPVIPGSSLKGMLRSVMEIATFSKMGVVEDKSLAYRDFKNEDYNKTLRSTTTVAGWIKYDNEKHQWTYKTVEHSVIFDDDLNASDYIDNKIDYLDSAKEKYAKINLNKEITFTANNAPTKNDSKRTKAIDIGDGQISGNIVFADKRVGAENKDYLRYNTVFHVNYDSYKEINNTKAIKDFFDFHNQDLINYLKNNPHKTYGIPAFFRIDKKNNIKAIGIAKLPKISYDHTVEELLSNQQKFFNHQASYDMTEAMMGCLRENGLSLKSRISFTDASLVKNKGYTEEIKKVLMSPRESYLAGYIDGQNTTQIFRGYNNKNNKLKGSKVYPRNSQFNSTNSDANASMISAMKFLKKDSEFKGEIFFHNLKPQELGALMWCLTFGNNENCYHGLGHAKPYGAGNVQIKIKTADIIANNPNNNPSMPDITDYITLFEKSMQANHFAQEWKDSPQIQHLISFAEINNNNNLSYMPLENETNSYKNCNSRKEVLMNWKKLNRNEESGDIFPKNYKAGRLVSLFDENNKIDAKLKQNEAEQKEKEKQEAFKSSLSDNELKVHDLKQFLQKNKEVTIQNPKIIILLEESLANAKSWELQEKKALLALVENKELCDFIPNKKPNKKKQRALTNYNIRKDLVDKLKQLITDAE